jgi:hypothetical protein
MKRILQVALLTLILTTSLSFTFQKEDNKIYYDKNRPLVWADFKGKPDNTTKLLALTASNMEYGFSSKDNDATITMNRFFDKTKSWVKETGKTDYLLKHEQGHFDMNEIYFRKFVKLLKEHKFYAKTLTDDFKKMYSTISSELYKQQDLYDKETNHSIIEAKQKEWNEKIARELKELEQYQDTKIEVHLL